MFRVPLTLLKKASLGLFSHSRFPVNPARWIIIFGLNWLIIEFTFWKLVISHLIFFTDPITLDFRLIDIQLKPSETNFGISVLPKLPEPPVTIILFFPMFFLILQQLLDN